MQNGKCKLDLSQVANRIQQLQSGTNYQKALLNRV